MSESQTVPALHKAISMLEYIAERSEPVSVKELSYSLDIPSASCYRMVNTMVKHNWLCEDTSGGLRVAFGLAHVARSYSDLKTRLRDIEPSLRNLAEELGMSVKIMLREGHFATTVLRAEPARPNAITSPVGYNVHLAVGSSPSVLLAQFDDHEIKTILAAAPKDVWRRQKPEDVWKRISDCRNKGFCFELGKYHPSIYACSVPFQLTDSIVVALTAVGWPEDFKGKKAGYIRSRLKEMAGQLNA